MNTALILAGGIGQRMRYGDCPKQYLPIHGRPIIEYSFRVFQAHDQIDRIVIVAAEAWREYISRLLQCEENTKLAAFAEPGESRQLSIFNGLKQIQRSVPETKKVVIHDAARPVLPPELVSACIDGLDEADGVMPALPLKDTCYQSSDGKHITGFLPRCQLFAGQAPESFRFPLYLNLHYQMTEYELKQISGSSEFAYKNGISVLMIEGSEKNIKVTTEEDLVLAEKYLGDVQSV